MSTKTTHVLRKGLVFLVFLYFHYLTFNPGCGALFLFLFLFLFFFFFLLFYTAFVTVSHRKLMELLKSCEEKRKNGG